MDANFVNSVTDYFKCVICHHVLKDPVLITECGHRFCRICYENLCTYSENKHIPLLCPLDRDPIDRSKVIEDKGINRAILDLQVRCDHDDKGCVWTGELRQLSTHLEQRCMVMKLKRFEERLSETDKEIKDLKRRLSEKDAEVEILRNLIVQSPHKRNNACNSNNEDDQSPKRKRMFEGNIRSNHQKESSDKENTPDQGIENLMVRLSRPTTPPLEVTVTGAMCRDCSYIRESQKDSCRELGHLVIKVPNLIKRVFVCNNCSLRFVSYNDPYPSKKCPCGTVDYKKVPPVMFS